MEPHVGVYIKKTFKQNMIVHLCVTTSILSWEIWEKLHSELPSWSVIHDKSCKLSNITRQPHFADVVSWSVVAYRFLL